MIAWTINQGLTACEDMAPRREKAKTKDDGGEVAGMETPKSVRVISESRVAITVHAKPGSKIASITGIRMLNVFLSFLVEEDAELLISSASSPI